MKRFAAYTILVALISLIGFLLLDMFLLSFTHNGSYYSHEKNVGLAYHRLEELKDTNKIVIIGGSNGGFSINSELIHQAFNMPVVNTGTHASIGVRMQFEIYKDLLRQGDIVIFCPEYHSTIDRLYGGTTLFRILSTHLPQAYCHISFLQWVYLQKYIGIYYTETKSSSNVTEFDGPYSYKAVNEYGDIAWDREHQDSIGNLKNFYGEIDDRIIAYYQYVHSYAEEKGVRLVFLPPTLIKKEYDLHIKQIDSMIVCFQQNGIPWQSPPSRYSFPDSLYFDTPYHMTPSGANLRTERMIEDLRRILKQPN